MPPDVPGQAGPQPFAPLAGVRVLDLSRFLAGPFCAALLADLGAEVIKVEAPGSGDDARMLGPFRDGESVYFAQLNRQKQSITLNLRSPAGVELLHQLAGQCDVLVENFRPSVADRLGIAYADFAAAQQRLIYVSISGFGQDGPLASRPAYDLIVQAASGLMAITGFPEGPPTRVGDSFGDVCAGLFAAWSICAALFDRQRTGRGTHLDVSMFESLLAMQVTAFSEYQVTGAAPGRVGNRHPISTPFDTYHARDGLVVLAVATDRAFGRLAALIERPDLQRDPRFATDELRTAHEPELRELIEHWTRSRDVEDIVETATATGVPSSAIWNLEQALASAQAQHRQIVSSVAHPRAGRIDVVQQPVRFGDHRAVPAAVHPALGEHTDVVLKELLGLSRARIEQLRRSEVI